MLTRVDDDGDNDNDGTVAIMMNKDDVYMVISGERARFFLHVSAKIYVVYVHVYELILSLSLFLKEIFEYCSCCCICS